MLDAIQNRRSVRKYADEQVPPALLEEILEAGRLAPSGGNCQTCHFLVIQNSEIIARLNQLAQAEFAQMELRDDLYKSLKAVIVQSKNGRLNFAYNAPTLVIVANKIGYGNAMADSAVAIENMMLEATAQGIGSCWINHLYWLDDHPPIREYLLSLGLLEDETVCGAMSLGYALGEPRPPLPRHGNLVTFVP